MLDKIKLQIDNIKECIGKWQNHTSDDLLSDKWCTFTLAKKYMAFWNKYKFLIYDSSSSNQNARLLLNLILATQSTTTRITLLPLTLSLSSLMAMQSTLPAWPRHAWTHSTEFSSLCQSQINMVWSCDPEMNLQVGPPS